MVLGALGQFADDEQHIVGHGGVAPSGISHIAHSYSCWCSQGQATSTLRVISHIRVPAVHMQCKSCRKTGHDRTQSKATDTAVAVQQHTPLDHGYFVGSLCAICLLPRHAGHMMK